ncbi:MAG: hypothetical protein IPG04_27105 [Polyangiaceae bacterium]|nr:hypothetical protein [Polyangiaceae bacterium]
MSDASVTADAAYPAAALGAFAETLLRGKRVGVLGDATTPLGEELLSRGARLVHVYDPDPGRLAIAAAHARSLAQGRPSDGRGLRPILAQYADDLGVRDGAFDVVLVSDLSLFDDPLEVIRRARRLVSPSGVFIVASPNPEAKRFLLPPSGSLDGALGYYELFDAVSLQFPEVKMLGQAPFVGSSIVDFPETDPDVSVDTSLLEEPEAPEWYVVVASDGRVDVDPYALIEIPMVDVARMGAPDPVTLPLIPGAPFYGSAGHGSAGAGAALPEPPPSGPSDAEVALTEARTRISVLVTENETLREQLKDKTRAERAAAESSFRAQELEAELGEARRRVSELSRELESQIARVEEQDAIVQRLEAEIDHERRDREARRADIERAAALERELHGSRRRVAELEAQVAALEPPTLRSKELQQQRLLALESQRDELAARERELTARVGELERRARELDERGREADVKAQGLEARRRELEEQARDLERSLAAARREAAQATSRLAELDARSEAALVELATERERLAEERGKVLPLEQEVSALEAALRDRGREIARVQRELRETEQVGRGSCSRSSASRGAACPAPARPAAALRARGRAKARRAASELRVGHTSSLIARRAPRPT